MSMAIGYEPGYFTFEKAVERAKRLVAGSNFKNPRILKDLTGPHAGLFTVIVDDADGHPLCTGWVDPSKGPNVLGDETAFTLERKCQ